MDEFVVSDVDADVGYIAFGIEEDKVTGLDCSRTYWCPASKLGLSGTRESSTGDILVYPADQSRTVYSVGTVSSPNVTHSEVPAGILNDVLAYLYHVVGTYRFSEQWCCHEHRQLCCYCKDCNSKITFHRQ
jgi:hypothetical protein